MNPKRKLYLLLAITLIQICLVGTGCGPSGNTQDNSAPTSMVPLTAPPLSESDQPVSIPTAINITTTSTVAGEAASTPDGDAFQSTVLQSNGNCSLPCWWNIIPGKTDWESARAFLEPFSLDIGPYERDGYTYLTAYIEQGSKRPIPDDFAVWDGTVQLISALGETGESFTPAALLDAYGPPDEIWLQTGNTPREGYLGFVTVLVYQHQGFLVHYGSQGTVEGEEVVSCIANAGNPLRLLAWNPDLKLNFVDAMAIGMSTSVTTYDIPLEAATGITLEEFYEDFSIEGTQVCLRTPRSLWPNP